MTGGRVYLWDPDGDRIAGLDKTRPWRRACLPPFVRVARTLRTTSRSSAACSSHIATPAHRSARRLLSRKAKLGDEVWLIEPIDSSPVAVPGPAAEPSEVAVTLKPGLPQVVSARL